MVIKTNTNDMKNAITLKEFATVKDMIMFYARQSVKSCFQIERENNIKVGYSEVKREYNYAISEHKSNISVANVYDEQLNNIPVNSRFMGGINYRVVGYVLSKNTESIYSKF